MKKTNQPIVITSFSHPDVEAHIANLDAELNEFAKLQAQEDAQKPEITEVLFNIKVKEPVWGKVQREINFVKTALLVESTVFDAAEIERRAFKKTQVLTNEANDQKQVLAGQKRKLTTLVIDPVKRKLRKWLIIFAVIVGSADAVLAFTAFRHGAYPMFQALIISLAIGAFIAISHLFYTKWIRSATGRWNQIFRISLVLAIAFIFFALVGNIRAEAANDVVSIAVTDNNVSAVSNPHFNGWAIAGVSFGLFGMVLLASLFLYKTKEEGLKEQEHDRVVNEILQLSAKIKGLEKEKGEIENHTEEEKRKARRLFDYATTAIQRCKSIGQEAITKYKQTFVRFHNDVAPAFFAQPIQFNYDESFHSSHHLKTENA